MQEERERRLSDLTWIKQPSGRAHSRCLHPQCRPCHYFTVKMPRHFRTAHEVDFKANNGLCKSQQVKSYVTTDMLKQAFPTLVNSAKFVPEMTSFLIASGVGVYQPHQENQKVNRRVCTAEVCFNDLVPKTRDRRC